MRCVAIAVAVALLPMAAAPAAIPTPTSEPAATPVGGIVVEPSAEPLGLTGCTIAARSPEAHDGLVAAQAGFRWEAGAARRNVTIERWRLDGNGYWQPAPETDATFATSPAMGSSSRGGSRRGLPLGSDEISCRAAAPGARRRYRTYVAACGTGGGPRLHPARSRGCRSIARRGRRPSRRRSSASCRIRRGGTGCHPPNAWCGNRPDPRSCRRRGR